MAYFKDDCIPTLKHKEINDVHFEEIDLLNRLHELLVGKGVTDEAINKSISDIQDLTVHHFSFEETLMQQYDYPDYEMHKYCHDAFLKDLGDVVKKWYKEKDRAQLQTFLEKDIIEWLTDHIENFDRTIVDYFQKKMKE